VVAPPVVFQRETVGGVREVEVEPPPVNGQAMLTDGRGKAVEDEHATEGHLLRAPWVRTGIPGEEHLLKAGGVAAGGRPLPDAADLAPVAETPEDIVGDREDGGVGEHVDDDPRRLRHGDPAHPRTVPSVEVPARVDRHAWTLGAGPRATRDRDLDCGIGAREAEEPRRAPVRRDAAPVAQETRDQDVLLERLRGASDGEHTWASALPPPAVDQVAHLVGCQTRERRLVGRDHPVLG